MVNCHTRVVRLHHFCAGVLVSMLLTVPVSCSLYIRPLIFSSSTVLKVAPSARTTLNITLSVAGPYLSTGACAAIQSLYLSPPMDSGSALRLRHLPECCTRCPYAMRATNLLTLRRHQADLAVHRRAEPACVAWRRR